MRGFLLGASLSVVFIVGCVAGAAAKPFVVPQANAQQAASMQKWEYFCFDKRGDEVVAEAANRAGRQGWEMAGQGNDGPYASTWCFKRAL